ncbi:MAG: N-6 DNA methylase [Pirellulales bacterium]
MARTMFLSFEEYLDKWDEIAGIFSREAVLKGSFDKYAEGTKLKRGTAEVDAAFLREIESWRESLARNFALRNNDLSQRDLNFAVQRTIDRIVFLRMCEDRGIEPYGQLGGIANGEQLYRRLCQLFDRADERYNSGLFHFQPEKDRAEPPDELTQSLALDDKPLKEILRALYYPDSPYEFSVLPAEILGQVYEQFLGKVIRLTAGHQAKIEDKPEVKKAGGVYYTPAYIVDYIVKNTVGKLVEKKAPKDVAKLRVLDPACGSGSFLVGAYQFLLDWHRDWYLQDGPAKHKKEIYQGRGGQWFLTTAEKKRILLSNIYGVDIDSQAVEVTKLSLLLKVLENENHENLENQLRLLHERALPDLGHNIKCGNSLIGPDFYNGQQMSLLDDEEQYRINVFDWKAEFPAIFKGKDGGFDAVIGNPPYGAAVTAEEIAYLRNTYETPANSLDTFLLFAERSHDLLRPQGVLGLIIPSGWTSSPSARPLRELFLENYRPLTFVSLPFDVFSGAYIDTVIVTAQRRASGAEQKNDVVDLYVFPQRFKIFTQEDFEPFHKTGNYRSWLESKDLEFLVTCSSQEAIVLNKVRNARYTLDHFVLVKRGIETFKPQTDRRAFSEPALAFSGILRRYVLKHGERAFVSYDEGIRKHKPWAFFSDERILIRQVLSRRYRLQATFISDSFLTNQSVQSLLRRENVEPKYSLQFLLGLLNSRLLSWYFRNVNSVARRDDFPKIIIKQTRELPICGPDISRSSGKRQHDGMVGLVSKMLQVKEQLYSARSPDEKMRCQRQIGAIDAQIDQLVYELYGLTDDEIRLVEAGTEK